MEHTEHHCLCYTNALHQKENESFEHRGKLKRTRNQNQWRSRDVENGPRV